MPVARYTAPRRSGLGAVRYRLRILHVVSAAEFKLKYTGSALGYLWSVLKPLALFTILYLVFGRVFKLGAISEFYGVSLLMGIVLFGFFTDGTNNGMYSVVTRDALMRKLVFPRIVVPIAATLSSGITFLINGVVVAGFILWKGIVPQPSWILILPLLLELYLLVLGVALLLSTLFVRLRDLGQAWELVTQLLFYASPVIYPVGFLPPFARQLTFLNPFTQILQDIRAIVFYNDLEGNTLTATDAFGAGGRLIPISIALLVFAAGVAVFKREEHGLAERL